MKRFQCVRPILAVAAALTIVSCGAEPTHEFASIPTRSAPPRNPTSPVIDGNGALAVTEFTVPPMFTCLSADPARALVTIGWNVPSARDVRLSLNGQVLPTGIQNSLPYQVPAGGPTGIGATIVFPCDGPPERTIAIEWTASGALPAQRTVSITKERGNA